MPPNTENSSTNPVDPRTACEPANKMNPTMKTSTGIRDLCRRYPRAAAQHPNSNAKPRNPHSKIGD